MLKGVLANYCCPAALNGLAPAPICVAGLKLVLYHETSFHSALHDCRHFAACNEALQACLSKHKDDNAEVTKKRHKKEVSKLFNDMVAAVKDLG